MASQPEWLGIGLAVLFSERIEDLACELMQVNKTAQGRPVIMCAEVVQPRFGVAFLAREAPAQAVGGAELSRAPGLPARL